MNCHCMGESSMNILHNIIYYIYIISKLCHIRLKFMLSSPNCQRCFVAVGSGRYKLVKRADGVSAGASVTAAAAGLHVTLRCAICGPSFEWVSPHKGMRLLLQADTGLNTSPCLYLLRVEREKGSIKGFTWQILIVFDTWRRCWTESRAQRKESQDFILIRGISLFWYFELVRKGFETPASL